MRYSANLTAGALKPAESRVIADLLLRGVSGADWKAAIEQENCLQAKSIATGKRLARLIRDRLAPFDPPFWELIRDSASPVVQQALLAAAVKHSPLLGDFLDLVVREQYRRFAPNLPFTLWEDYLLDCRGRDSEMPWWNDSTRRRLRSSVYLCLAQAGFLENTRSLKLQPVFLATPVLRYLESRDERLVLRCLQVSP
ncbi:DUF1819 family protein [Holophaga foetida]|uniref:DUF1819 family protein n=1 Tax=Holophaga foetida TaxID=35839 RepID=UPI000311F638|nr:DUF1819 family protein [Holophaga foetida]